jgi:hypothetical protein
MKGGSEGLVSRTARRHAACLIIRAGRLSIPSVVEGRPACFFRLGFLGSNQVPRFQERGPRTGGGSVGWSQVCTSMLCRDILLGGGGTIHDICRRFPERRGRIHSMRMM